jgi:hypothetical protein
MICCHVNVQQQGPCLHSGLTMCGQVVAGKVACYESGCLRIALRTFSVLQPAWLSPPHLGVACSNGGYFDGHCAVCGAQHV